MNTLIDRLGRADAEYAVNLFGGAFRLSQEKAIEILEDVVLNNGSGYVEDILEDAFEGMMESKAYDEDMENAY